MGQQMTGLVKIILLLFQIYSAEHGIADGWSG